MKFLNLAAGSGTRLGKQTEFLPKSLIRINKKTILERQLNIIKKNQKNNVLIIAGPNKEKFLEFQVDIFEDVEYKKHKIFIFSGRNRWFFNWRGITIS